MATSLQREGCVYAAMSAERLVGMSADLDSLLSRLWDEWESSGEDVAVWESADIGPSLTGRGPASWSARASGLYLALQTTPTSGGTCGGLRVMVSKYLRGLSMLPPCGLVKRLRRFIADNDGKVSENELTLAQELLRRARQAEAAQLMLRQVAHSPGYQRDRG